MESVSSRRTFLAGGLALPALAAAPQSKPVGMSHRVLGKTGLKVAPIGFGCKGTSEPGVLQRAFDLGMNLFDTGRMYGNNERMVGVALKDRRKQAIIATKFGAMTKDRALAELEISLKELQTDYIDIWQFQNTKTRTEDVTDGVLEAMQTAKKAGKVRFVGTTSHLNVPMMLAHVMKVGGSDVTMVGYNFTLQPDVTEAIDAARKAGMGIMAIKVLAGGYSRIANQPPRFDGPPEALLRTLKQDGAMTASIRWALKNESIDTAAVAMSDYAQVEANVQALSQPYTPADEKLLGAKLAFLAPRYCRMCGDCGGVCDKGVRVSDMLRFLTYAEGYRDFPQARQGYLDLPVEERQIHCSDCQSCTVNCPNGVQVRNRLLLAKGLFA